MSRTHCDTHYLAVIDAHGLARKNLQAATAAPDELLYPVTPNCAAAALLGLKMWSTIWPWMAEVLIAVQFTELFQLGLS